MKRTMLWRLKEVQGIVICFVLTQNVDPFRLVLKWFFDLLEDVVLASGPV